MSGELEVHYEESPQSEVEAFYERVQFWQQQINQANQDKKESLNTICHSAIRELDAICPYYDKYVFVRGTGLYPQFDPDGTPVSEEFVDSEGQIGLHQGVDILTYEQDDQQRHALIHKLQINQLQAGTLPNTILDTRDVFAAFSMRSELMPIDEIEDAFISDTALDGEARGRILNDYSRKLSSLFCSTAFRRLDRGRQIQKVERFISEAEAKVGIREKQFIGNPQYIYLPVANNETWAMVPWQSTDQVIEGTCLGLGTIEIGLLSGHAVRRDADLLDKHAGLCLIVQPTEETVSELKLQKQQPIYIPLSSHDFDASVY